MYYRKSTTRKSLFSCIKGVNLELLDSKVVYVAENDCKPNSLMVELVLNHFTCNIIKIKIFLLISSVCFNMDLDALFASNNRTNRTFNIEGFEVYSSSNFSDCVSF